MNAVAAAQAKGWRRTYFNALTIPFWGVHILAIVGIAILGFSWRGVALCMDLGYSDDDIHKMVATNASRMLGLDRQAA